MCLRSSNLFFFLFFFCQFWQRNILFYLSAKAFLRNHSEEEEKQGQEEEEGKGKEKRRLEMSVRDRRTAYELVGGRSFLDLPKGAVAIVTSRARVSANSVDVDWPSIDADSKSKMRRDPRSLLFFGYLSRSSIYSTKKNLSNDAPGI